MQSKKINPIGGIVPANSHRKMQIIKKRNQEHDIKDLLSAAHSRNLLCPCKEHNPCFKNGVNIANEILYWLDDAYPCTLLSREIADILFTDVNVIRIYLRQLVRLGVVVRYPASQRRACWQIQRSSVGKELIYFRPQARSLA
jgi:hypothetical protein